MEKIPMEWVDKLFNCMEMFYGETWRKLYPPKNDVSVYKTVWQTILSGLTHAQIKYALVFYKNRAKHYSSKPPHAMEFYKVAKESNGVVSLLPKINDSFKKGSPEIRKKYMDDINKTLGKKEKTLVEIDIYKKLVT